MFYASLITSWTLPSDLENVPTRGEGLIASIPNNQHGYTTFTFNLLRLNGKFCDTKIKLNWRNCKYHLHVGEQWYLTLKLKKPHSLSNPASFDVEENFFQNHLRVVGTVLPRGKNYFMSKTSWRYCIENFRQYLLEKILKHFKDHPFIGVMLALSLGITSHITQQQWQVFRLTGTNHLVAISGLHIGLVAGLCGKLASVVWRRIPDGPLLLPVAQVSAVSSIVAACIYSVISGMSVSTLRSLLMISIVMLGRLSFRHVTSMHSLLLSLGIILLINPLAILTMSFWLSYVAVAFLVYGMNARLSPRGWWWKWGRAQWVVTLGMLPCVLFFFQQASLLAIPSNVIAIPFISFLVVPSCLIGVFALIFSEWMGVLILKFTLNLLTLFWGILNYFATFTHLVWHRAFINSWIALISHGAAILTLLPTGIPSRSISLLWWLPLLFQHLSLPDYSHIRVTVFDVGQGLATLIQTNQHCLIYDTGAKVNEDFDMGNAVVLPYLRQMGIDQIDVMTISHGDNDHIGGANSILGTLPVKKIITSVPERFKNYPVSFCSRGLSWNWDGVTFQFLYPEQGTSLKGNNASCVLKVTTGRQSLLLTGDIESKGERLLLNTKNDMRATVLLAPHHGSKTSSTLEFIQAVRPKYVIFSCGYLNSYHHPHPLIQKRYQRLGTHCLNTVASGAIIMTLQPDSDNVHLLEYRKKYQKFWQQRP